MAENFQTEDMFAAEEPVGESPYVLHELEVFNWGPFSGMHRAAVDPRGTAIIGPTGSGKTTLIDGLMTLLVLQPRYNLASTGGHESDRTLISYVRGFLGGDGATGGGDEVARPGKTLTGLCGTYRNGEETLRLGAVLWTDGASNAAQDLKRRWIFSLADAESESLESWLRLVNDDGVRILTRHEKETPGLRVFTSKTAYLAHVRKFFDVGDNAFTLLNRAAGLKQLNSIDEIFRELVLDDRSTFDRALEVAGEFDNLESIHAELETARRQVASLQPIAKAAGELDKAREREDALVTLKRILPVWFAISAERLWGEIAARLAKSIEGVAVRLREAQQALDAHQTGVDTLHERYLRLGGNVIDEVRNTNRFLAERVRERRGHADDYQKYSAQFGLDPELSEASLANNQEALIGRRVELEKLREATEGETLEARSRLRDVREQAAQVELELRKVRERPGSNIPAKFQDFRAALAERLALGEEDLPFVAEMVEVKPDEGQWRGAIERAIGSERLRLLVPDNRIDVALRWVNDRDNRLHVRLQRARPDARPGEFFPDGFTRKLNFKEHPLRETLKALLAARDRHCVASPEVLRSTEHAMTIEGTMSDRRGRFEKQDQRRIDEGWMTGFDNRDQLRALEEKLVIVREQSAQWDATASEHQKRLGELVAQLALIDRLCDLDFATIDLPGAEAELLASEARLQALLDPGSNVGKAKEEFEAAKRELDVISQKISGLDKEIALQQRDLDRARSRQQESAARVGDGLSETEAALAEAKLALPSGATAEKLGDVKDEQLAEIETQLGAAQERVNKIEQRLIRLMGAAKDADTGALAESGTELEDVADFLARLKVLEVEALPDKLGRFLDYLNRSSDQGVTQLLAGITEEVDGIEQRLTDLNHTLAKVDFQPGRYLQLQPKRIRHERLRSLESAQRVLRSAVMKEDEGNSQFKALKAVVEILREAGDNRRQVGSRALLDPRYRLEFSVVVVDRETSARSAPRSGSQSGSGGEKELMASHILTASLSYALCPTGASRPLYGTVVLDEAFSKSSPSAAGRIIEALRIFGLNPIFVTPNKEIGLLKKHTRRVICVQRTGKEAKLATISWEKLDELAQRLGKGAP